ncbi:hypothetical protein M9458_005202, partial [Cirrhinus mrigala]
TSDSGHAGGDRSAAALLSHPDCPAAESVLRQLPQCNALPQLPSERPAFPSVLPGPAVGLRACKRQRGATDHRGRAAEPGRLHQNL